jgi:hypothetical protein
VSFTRDFDLVYAAATVMAVLHRYGGAAWQCCMASPSAVKRAVMSSLSLSLRRIT